MAAHLKKRVYEEFTKVVQVSSRRKGPRTGLGKGKVIHAPDALPELAPQSWVGCPCSQSFRRLPFGLHSSGRARWSLLLSVLTCAV